MLSQLQNLARDLNIDGRVSFTGFISQEQLREIYYASHIFLHPSQTGRDGNQEGIPNSMLEAMASGLPVFATRHDTAHGTITRSPTLTRLTAGQTAMTSATHSCPSAIMKNWRLRCSMQRRIPGSFCGSRAMVPRSFERISICARRRSAWKRSICGLYKCSACARLRFSLVLLAHFLRIDAAGLIGLCEIEMLL